MSDAPGVGGAVLVCHHDESLRAAYEHTLVAHDVRVRTAGTLDDLPSLAETDVRAALLSRGARTASVIDLDTWLEGTHVRVALLVPFDAETVAVARLPDQVDECLSEPVADERLVDTVEHLLGCARYDTRLRRYYELASRVASADPNREADASEVGDLREELERLRADLAEADDDLGPVDRFAVAVGSDC